MKVLLYETGNIGHRPVYRQYYKSALEQVGVEVELHCEPDYKKLFGFNNYLQKLAAEQRCDLVHILTLDDHMRRMFASRSSSRTCPIIGTYYLYQNISHIYKGWAIRQLFKRGKVSGIIIPSAAEIVSPQILKGRNLTVFSLPDPIENDCYFNIAKQKAHSELGLPSKWNNETVVLFFGALDKRRGLDALIQMLIARPMHNCGIRFLFAGKIDPTCLSDKDTRSLLQLSETGLVHLIDRWLSSDDVANVFSSADVFVSMNEKRFKGASSTIGRAVKAGLTIVAPNDSVAGICAKTCGHAELFRRGDADDFVHCIRRASALSNESTSPLADNPVALTVNIEEFGKRLVHIYEKLM
jgi:glycosyltransferase involved in cell wall biosynthesis